MIYETKNKVINGVFGDVSVVLAQDKCCKKQGVSVKLEFEDWLETYVEAWEEGNEKIAFCGGDVSALIIGVSGQFEVQTLSNMLRSAADSIDLILKSGAYDNCL